MRRLVAMLLVAWGCDGEVAPAPDVPVTPTAEPSAVPSAPEAVNVEATAPSATPPATVSARVPSASARRVQAPAPSAKPTEGDKAVESNFAVWLQSAGRYTVGKPGSVQAVLVAKGEYKCNDKYPYKVALAAAPEGVSYPNSTARNASKGAARTVVDVPVTASTPGDKTISGTFHFSVCNESSCKIAKRALSVTVAVNER